MRNRFIAGAGVVLVAAVIGILSPSPASAWPPPTVTATGGGCTGETGTDALPRGLIYWTVTNHETEFPRSPMTISAVKVTNNFPTSWNTPLVVPNTGTSTAVAQSYVPPTYGGKVTFKIEVEWSGLDGSHPATPAEASVTVQPCPQAVTPPPSTTTTTSTTVPTTTTTAAPTTSIPGVAVAAEAVAEAPVPVPVAAQPAFTG